MFDITSILGKTENNIIILGLFIGIFLKEFLF